MLMTINLTSAEGEVLKKQEWRLTNNQLNRIHLPELYGKALYLLKKKRYVKIKMACGTVIEYSLKG